MFRVSFNTLARPRVFGSLFNTYNKARLSTSTDGGLCDKLAFIGAGMMAQAMIRPLINNGYQKADKIAIYDVNNHTMKDVQKDFPDIQMAQSIEEVVTDADLIVCAVKPQNINAQFFEQFPKDTRQDATLISILAGTTVGEFSPSGINKIVRAMPNTPATIGQGITVWCCTPNLTTEERSSVKEVLSSFGKEIYVDDEKFVDMSTSISGSGPAYIFLLMEAMIDTHGIL